MLNDKFGHNLCVADLDEDVELLIALPGRDSHSVVLTTGQAQRLGQALIHAALETELGVQAYRREWAAKGIAR